MSGEDMARTAFPGQRRLRRLFRPAAAVLAAMCLLLPGPRPALCHEHDPHLWEAKEVRSQLKEQALGILGAWIVLGAATRYLARRKVVDE